MTPAELEEGVFVSCAKHQPEEETRSERRLLRVLGVGALACAMLGLLAWSCSGGLSESALVGPASAVAYGYTPPWSNRFVDPYTKQYRIGGYGYGGYGGNRGYGYGGYGGGYGGYGYGRYGGLGYGLGGTTDQGGYGGYGGYGSYYPTYGGNADHPPSFQPGGYYYARARPRGWGWR